MIRQAPLRKVKQRALLDLRGVQLDQNKQAVQGSFATHKGKRSLHPRLQMTERMSKRSPLSIQTSKKSKRSPLLIQTSKK